MSGVALLGGTFDPIHDGHLHLARTLLEDASLSRVLLVPAYRNPLKETPSVSAADRLAMVNLAVEEEKNPRLGVLDIEVKSPAPSYTSVTLQKLAAENPSERLVLVLGNEVFAGLAQWHDPKTVLTLADIVVIPRNPIIPFRPVEILTAVGLRYTSVSSTRAKHSQGTRVIELRNFTALPYSATAIRADLAQGVRPEGLRHTVWSYIKEKRLYAVS